MLPSFSIQIPCGKRSMPAPKLLSNLPDGSNSRTGDRLEPAHELTPHRSATQMWPLGAMKTALLDPIVRPGGSWNHFSTVRYGFGCELGLASGWADAIVWKAMRIAPIDVDLTCPPVSWPRSGFRPAPR